MRVAAGPDAVAPGGHLWPEVALPRGQEHLPRRTRLLLHTLSRPRPPPGLYTRVAAPAAGCSGTAAAQLPAPRAGAPARHLEGQGARPLTGHRVSPCCQAGLLSGVLGTGPRPLLSLESRCPWH